MKHRYHGEELRAANLDCPPPDYLPAKESGSVYYANYNRLLNEGNHDDARLLGIRALERVLWAKEYPIADIELRDQSDIATFDDELIKNLLVRQQEVVLEYTTRYEEMLPILYDRLSNQLDSAIEGGYISADVRTRLDTVRRQTEWIVNDGMGNTLGMASCAQKSALISSDVFRVSSVSDSSEECITEVFTHEMIHRLAGVHVVDDDDGNGIIYRNGLAPIGVIAQNKGSSWLNEATTERIAWHLMHNDWHVKNQRVETLNYTYDEESLLLHSLIRAVPFKTLTDYYFDESEDGQSKRELHKVFRDTVGVTYPQFMKDSTDPSLRMAYIKELMSAHLGR